MIDLGKAQEKIKEYDRFEKNVWNAAIEAAAQKVNEEMGEDEIDTYYIEREIRKLKK